LRFLSAVTSGSLAELCHLLFGTPTPSRPLSITFPRFLHKHFLKRLRAWWSNWPSGSRAPPSQHLPVLLVVEGVNDVQFLKSISSILARTDPSLPDLLQWEFDGRCLFLPTGGEVASWTLRLSALPTPQLSLRSRNGRRHRCPSRARFAAQSPAARKSTFDQQAGTGKLFARRGHSRRSGGRHRYQRRDACRRRCRASNFRAREPWPVLGVPPAALVQAATRQS
jgi:hypothetical protein